MPELEVHGVRNGDARALLSSAVRFKMDERVRDRIVAETRGNPLALLELPRGLTATQLAGGFGLLGAQALTGRIEESFVRRLEALSDDARRLLLVAAAEPVGDPLLLWRACERLWIRTGGRGGRGGGRVAGDRRAGDVPASVGALGGVSVGGGGGSPRGPLGVGGGDRSGDRPGPSCVASGCGRGRTRRAGRLGARALGRPGAGARRARRRGGVPPARRRADEGPGEAGGSRSGRGPGEPPGRRVRRGSRAGSHGGDRAARRVPARPGGPAACPRRLRRSVIGAMLPRCC